MNGGGGGWLGVQRFVWLLTTTDTSVFILLFAVKFISEPTNKTKSVFSFSRLGSSLVQTL
jgi:hypothetical protein